MERRDIGYVLAYAFAFIFVAIIGISFSVFVDKKQQVEVRAISVVSDGNVVLVDLSHKNKESTSLKLKVNSPKVGTKPVSGELDTQTDIPYTVSDQVGSEGAYAKFGVISGQKFGVFLKSVSGVPQEELENVKIAVDGSEKKPHSALDVGKLIEEKDGSDKTKKFTVLVWLDQHAGKKLVGSKIEIELEVRVIE